jgi:hypothetical protein
MKSTTKRVLAIVLAMVMMMALSVTALAAGTPYDPTKGEGEIGAKTNVTVPYYRIQVPESQQQSVKADRSTAPAGTKITLTVPAGTDGSDITVLDKNGNKVALTKVNDTTYTFLMPAADVTVSAGAEDLRLITDDHFAYIEGYPDGTFKPEGSLTRAEAATIFYRLLVDNTTTKTASFSDVKAGQWYYTAVTTLAGKGIIAGYPDGTFKPNASVTRAEFCAMAARFFSLSEGTVKYTDVAESFWGYKYIASAVAKGWLTDSAVNYEPNGAISRKEVVAIVNRMLSRAADEKFVDSAENLARFTDVNKTDSFYYDVMEAANAHDHKTVSGKETWTAIR